MTSLGSFRPESKYLTSPPPSDKMPGGIPYIVGNEAAELLWDEGNPANLHDKVLA